MVEDFMTSISQPAKKHLWLWNDSPSYTFSVKFAYKKLANL